MPPALLSAQTARWRRRMPRAVLTAVVLVVQLALVVTEVVMESPCTEAAPCRWPLDGAVYNLATSAEFLAVAAALLALLLPRAAVWVAALSALLLAGPAIADSSIPSAWGAAALLYLALAGLDFVGRLRQDVQSRTWGAPTLHYPGVDDPATLPGRLPRDEDTRALAGAVLLVGLVAGIALGLWNSAATAEVRDFEAHAIRSNAVVTEVVDDEDSYRITVLVAGRSVQLEPIESYQRGQTVAVLVDAADPGHVALVAEPEDPSWRGGLAAVVLALAAALAARLWSRGARRARLVRGGAAVRVRLGRTPHGLLLTATDDVRFERPLAFVKDLLPSAILLPAPLSGESWHPDEWDGAADDADDLDDPWAAGGAAADLTGLSDHELAEWADQVVTEDDDDWDDEDDLSFRAVPTAADGGEVVTVVGLHQDGDPIAVLTDDGTTLVSSAGVRDPWTWRRLRDRALTRRGGRRSPSSDGLRAAQRTRRRRAHAAAATSGQVPGDLGARVFRSAVPLIEPIALPLAYLIALAMFPAARWFLDGSSGLFDLGHVFLALVVAGWTRFLAGLKGAALRPHPVGLLHCGWWFDELLPAQRVTAVVPGQDSIVLRLREPDDALALPARCVVPLSSSLREPPSAEYSAEAVRSWLARATPAGSGWRRPSLTLLPPTITVLAFLLAWAMPRLTGG